MRRPFLPVAMFTIAVVLVFVGLGELITRVSGEGGPGRLPARASDGEGPEAGEQVFWGRGKCSTCHAVGTRGSAIRGPDQGDRGPLGLPIGQRAVARARERAEATGKPYTATDYLVEALTDPGAHVVAGYKNEMPDPTRPPIGLTAAEVRAVVRYLQSLGGVVERGAIRLPERLARPAAAGAAPAWQPYPAGDAARGEALFFDSGSPAGCATCHAVRGRGGDVGPALTEIAGTRDARFIVESILEPSKAIASGYEASLLVTADGRYLSGVVIAEDATGLELADREGRRLRVPKAEVRQRAVQTTSLMPGNFGEILTVQDFQDLVAYLLTLK